MLAALLYECFRTQIPRDGSETRPKNLNLISSLMHGKLIKNTTLRQPDGNTFSVSATFDWASADLRLSNAAALRARISAGFAVGAAALSVSFKICK